MIPRAQHLGCSRSVARRGGEAALLRTGQFSASHVSTGAEEGVEE